MEVSQTEIQKRFENYLRTWHRTASLLHAVSVFLGLVATISALVVASFADSLVPGVVRIFAFGSAVSIGIITAFDIPAKASATRNGWRHLNTALLRYQAGRCNIDDLIKAYEEGERMLGNEITFQGPSQST